MFARMKKILAPPRYPGDEEKSAHAWFINTVQIYFLATLLAVALLLTFFLPVHHLEAYAVILALFLVSLAGRVLMFRGQLRAAGVLMITMIWALFTGLAAMNGGTASPLLFSLLSTVLVSGLAIRPRVGMVFVVASILTVLGFVLLDQAGIVLPQLFAVYPLVTWLLFSVSLVFVFAVMNLVLTGLRDALARERRQNAAREQAEQAQRQSEERFQMFMRHFPGLAYMLDSELRVLFANQGFSTFLHLDPAEMIGRKNEEIFGRDFGAKVSADDNQVLRTGIPQEIIEEFGGKTWSTHKFRIQPLEAEALLGGVTLDISERVRAEDLLRESENRYKMIFEQAPIAINITRGPEITYANPAFLRMFGYGSFDEAKIDVPLAIFTPESRVQMQEMIARRTAGLAAPFEYEVECQHKDGRRFPIYVYIARTQFQDGPSTVAFILDITERKRAEDKIRSTLQEKEVLLQEVHHRVKNNLQVMIALIKMRAGRSQDQATRQFLKELQGQAHTMALVYEQLYQSEDLARVNMQTYLHQLVNSVTDIFGGRPALQVRIDAALMLDVALAMPCGMIVNELFTNTLKHAFPPEFQGRPQVEISLRQEGSACRLRFSDNGAGLPPGTDWLSGKTLGLHLVHLWATHQLGGSFAVESEEGSTFTIDFSLTRE